MGTAHVEVSGIVQGVGFRWFARQAGRRHHLAGWVRNRADGSVEIAAAGNEPELQRFLDEIRHGPDGARVSAVRSLPVDGLTPLPEPFEIMR
jgi:acylphosphatase